jgi:RNA polymerase sigma-70 factor (ECF subfamily)
MMAQVRTLENGLIAEDTAARGATSDLTALAHRARDGDTDATRSLLREIVPAVRRTCKGVLGSEHADLEDTIQESLVAFVQALPSYRFDGDITHYAVRIAFRATLHTKKRSIKWRDRFRLTGTIEETTDFASSSPSEELMLTQRRKALERVLGKLPREQAEALTLRIMLDFSMNDIASICDVPLNTVKTRLRLGKDALRRHMERDAVLRAAMGGNE